MSDFTLGAKEEKIVVGRMNRPIYPRSPNDMLASRNGRNFNKKLSKGLKKLDPRGRRSKVKARIEAI